VGGIYELEVENNLKCYATSQPKANRAKLKSRALLHQRLVHLNAADMLKLSELFTLREQVGLCPMCNWQTGKTAFPIE
jgi:hypothetical protein